MRRWLRWLFVLVSLLSLLLLAAIALLQSEWLQHQVHQRLVAEMTKATGGAVSLGRYDFSWDWSDAGQVRVRDLVIRGKEAADQPPLIRIPSAVVRLKVLSYVSPKADLRSVTLEKPELHIITYPDGSTNFPGPPRKAGGKPVLEQFVSLAIDEFTVRDGELTWDLRKIPLEIAGQRLSLDFRHQASGPDAPRYLGYVSARALELKGWRFQEGRFDLDSEVAIEKDRIRFAQLRLVKENSIVDAQGEIKPLTPDWKQWRTDAGFHLTAAMPDLVKLLKLPIEPVGTFEAKGKLEWQDEVIVTADAAATGWSMKAGGREFKAIAWKAPLRYEKGRVETRRLALDWLNGIYLGRAWTDFSSYEIAGTAARFRLNDLAPLVRIDAPPANTLIAGPVKITGKDSVFSALARLTLLPAEPDRPLQGSLNFHYDSAGQTVRLEPSYLDLAGNRVDLSGDLATGVRISLTSRDLSPLPIAAKLPFSLVPGEGEASFSGIVRGSLNAPQVTGELEMSALRFEGRVLDYVAASLEANPSGIRFQSLQADGFGAEVEGQGKLGLRDWAFTNTSPFEARVKILKADVARLVKETGWKLDVQGNATGNLEIAGTAASFRAEGPVSIAGGRLEGQPLGTVKGLLHHQGDRTAVSAGTAEIGGQTVKLTGEWVNAGRFALDVEGSGVELARIEAWKSTQPDVTGRAQARLTLAGRVENGRPRWTRIDGRAGLTGVMWKDTALGDAELASTTRGNALDLTLRGRLRGVALRASGTAQLDTGLPGKLSFDLDPLAPAQFEELRGSALPFEGSVKLTGTLAGPLEHPNQWKGTVRAADLLIYAKEASPAIKRDLAIRNAGPLEFDFDARGLNLRDVKLAAKETNLQATGTVAWTEKSPWNLRLNGQVDLGVLTSFKPDLMATGTSSMDATVRGTFDQPLVNGRLEFRDASFFLRDVANGLEKVNGLVVFDRSRARVERLTAESGGGQVSLGGFVGFGADLSYQLQGRADNVRIRYPVGISTAVNASLSLTGSAARSLLSGSITVLRSNISAQTDIGNLLSESQKSSTPVRIENEFLREMQFDVRVDTALDAEVTTSLTQNVQAEMNLRIRGTPARPIVLGRLAFTQGEINFFGSKYIIDRGEVNFYNPTRIEPVINFDLQTRVRGVLVTLNFAGPASKINLGYRSDPPLQPDEIVALLAVGRTPSGSIFSGGSSVQNPGILSGSANALLGQAATAPLTGRLQRLFGVSRLRIDPQLTGIENTAQARLTLEQQVSRDVTVTFITNLNRTQQQIVSVEWDFSREWSAIAIRDENGVFGLDFFYRKRFK